MTDCSDNRADLLAGFELETVRPILERAAGSPVAAFSHRAAPVGSGQPGASQFADFNFTRPDGAMGAVRLFVKRCDWHRRPESVHYAYLEARGVPVPRVFGTLTAPGGEEIIFLECLSRTGINRSSALEWQAMIDLIARFNACPATPEYAPFLHNREAIGRMPGGWWLSGSLVRLSPEELVSTLHSCGAREEDLPVLVSAALRLFEEVDRQAQGLIHQDLMMDNVGWRGDAMVVFDLHKNAIGPRFSDIAPYLNEPGWEEAPPFPSAEISSPHRREELVERYLEQYNRLSQSSVSLRCFEDETAALFWTHRVLYLGWLHEQGQTRSVQAVLRRLSRQPF